MLHKSCTEAEAPSGPKEESISEGLNLQTGQCPNCNVTVNQTMGEYVYMQHRQVTCHCRVRVSFCNIYVVQQVTQCGLNE